MHLGYRTIGLALLLSWTPAASAQEVVVDFAKGSRLANCGTYTWSLGHPTQHPLQDERIVDAIDAGLAAKGFRRLESGGACIVTYHASLEQQKQVDLWEPGGWRFRGGYASVDVRTVQRGMLVVDIADAESRRLLWRGVARDTLSDKPEKNHKKLAKAVDKMFKDLPTAADTVAARQSPGQSQVRLQR